MLSSLTKTARQLDICYFRSRRRTPEKMMQEATKRSKNCHSIRSDTLMLMLVRTFEILESSFAAPYDSISLFVSIIISQRFFTTLASVDCLNQQPCFSQTFAMFAENLQNISGSRFCFFRRSYWPAIGISGIAIDKIVCLDLTLLKWLNLRNPFVLVNLKIFQDECNQHA